MPALPIELYGPIGAALLTAIAVLWRRCEASEQRERALYREMLTDSDSLRAIAKHMEEQSLERRESVQLLKQIATRMESFAASSPHSGEPRAVA